MVVVTVGCVIVVELGPWVVTVVSGPAVWLVVVVVCGPEVVVVEVVEDASGCPPLADLPAIVFQDDKHRKDVCLGNASVEKRCFREIDSADFGAREMV